MHIEPGEVIGALSADSDENCEVSAIKGLRKPQNHSPKRTLHARCADTRILVGRNVTGQCTFMNRKARTKAPAELAGRAIQMPVDAGYVVHEIHSVSRQKVIQTQWVAIQMARRDVHVQGKPVLFDAVLFVEGLSTTEDFLDQIAIGRGCIQSHMWHGNLRLRCRFEDLDLSDE
ncbi:MAG TPA: hypothetical protein VL614_15220 [Acetobacteraceae bacterium]|nr:hypothetical protein [Acetobacteraceae bacterium]